MSKLIMGLVMALFLCGCATYNNARKYYDKHPEAFARDCAGEYKQVDSVGQPIIEYIPSNNTDYTQELDSLAKELTEIYRKTIKDSIKAAQVSQDCAKIVSAYKHRVEQLSAKIGALNANYKKPVPDTVKIEVPTFRVAPATVAKMESDKNVIDSLVTRIIFANVDRDEWKGKAKKRWWIISGIIAFAGIGLFLKFKRII